jgi:methyl-accepting chemotaxis protein
MSEKVNAESKIILQDNSNILSNWFLDKAKNIEITSKLITNTSNGDFSVNYLSHYKDDPDINDMYIALPDKKFIDGSGWTPSADFDPTARSWYKDAISKKSLVFSDPYIDAQTNQIVITPSIQITDSQNEVAGVLAADIFLTTLVQKVSDMKVMDGKGYAFLIDNKGTMISHPIKELDGINIIAPEDKKSAAKDKKTVTKDKKTAAKSKKAEAEKPAPKKTAKEKKAGKKTASGGKK